MSHSNGIRLFDAGPDFFLLLLSAIYLHHPLKTGHNTTATDKFPPECWILVDWANWVWMVVVVVVNSGSQMSEHTIRTLNPQNPAEPELDGAASFNGTVFNGVVVGLNLKVNTTKVK